MNTKKIYHHLFLIAAVVFGLQQVLQAQKIVKPAPLYFAQGKLIYTPDTFNNRIPDFSYCGYKASEQPIPTLSIKVVVPVAKGDATARI